MNQKIMVIIIVVIAGVSMCLSRKSAKQKPFPYGRPRRIHPMLAERGSKEDIERLHTYDEQRKFDGSRCIIVAS